MGGKSNSKSKKNVDKPERSDASSEAENNVPDGGEEEYKVEKIVGDRKVKGRTQYKVRWEGYGTDDETWEDEGQLNCEELIEEYLADQDDGIEGQETEVEEVKKPKENKKEKKKKAGKKSSQGGSEPAPSPPKKARPGPVNGENEYVVDKIIDVHNLKSGKREFLVRWAGFGKGDDTWEPEENLAGTDILEKFLEKVRRAKEIPAKELRIKRAPTDRYTLTTEGNRRRHSRRNANKQRVKYYDAE